MAVTHDVPLTVRILALMFFGVQERIRVWKKLHTQIRNNMRLEESLRQLLRHAKESKSPLEGIFSHILTTLGHGRPLDAALDGIASQEEIMLIASAQSGGKLAEGFALAIRVLEAKGVMRKCLVTNLSAPILMFLACIAMMVVIALHVMPQLALVSDPRTWSGASYVLYLLSSFIASWWGIVAGIAFLAALVVVFVSFRFWTGAGRRLADRLIPWSIYRLTVGTVWLYTIATRMKAGQHFSQILSRMEGTSSPYLREIVSAILRHSRHGEDFGTALQDSGMAFPSREIVDDMRVYARMPEFQERMAEIADTWLEDGVEKVKSCAQKIGVTVNLLILGQLILISLVAGNFESQLKIGGM